MYNTLLKAPVTIKVERSQRERPATVRELIARFADHARTYYRKKNGRPTGHAENMAHAMRAVEYTTLQLDGVEGSTDGVSLRVLADLDPNDFGADDLRAAREVMIQAQLSMETINNRVSRIRQVFRWAQGRNWIERGVITGLESVESLQEGRCKAKVSPPKTPVPADVFWKTVEAATRPFALAMKMQWHTGMRSGELIQMRASRIVDVLDELHPLKPEDDRRTARTVDLDPARTWYYEVPRAEANTPITVAGNKSDRGAKRRIVLLMPEARELLAPMIQRARFQTAFNFVDEATLFPYTVNTYRQTVVRLCTKNSLPTWTPHDVRRAFCTRMEELYGLDVAQLLAGHTSGVTTEGYITRDYAALALKIEGRRAG